MVDQQVYYRLLACRFHLFSPHHSMNARIMRAHRQEITALPLFLKEYSRTSRTLL
ncbi:hypothetical protein CKO_04168 [Citrobacter koseri ATCC BAA-895]|uniref:Uncharacterized protein n=1 Tax=Citrobacter koseri (strain ATCC BAA-895 / CDC 4225-83 / SGSC4696) TaxID=290338 RepID=A8AP19_CITK8|nr:hypothetical protein CKO_04168 [Citrobacter koseri ATCC BAA-895]